MTKGYIVNSEDIDFSVRNHRKLAFRFNNANCWMIFNEHYDAYNCRIDACKLGKFYNAAHVTFKYYDEIKNEKVVDVLNNRGFCSTELYTFRTITNDVSGLKLPMYYTDSELFEKA